MGFLCQVQPKYLTRLPGSPNQVHRKLLIWPQVTPLMVRTPPVLQLLLQIRHRRLISLVTGSLTCIILPYLTCMFEYHFMLRLICQLLTLCMPWSCKVLIVALPTHCLT